MESDTTNTVVDTTNTVVDTTTKVHEPVRLSRKRGDIYKDIEAVKRILFDYYYGVKIKDICRNYDVSTTTVYGLLKNNKVPMSVVHQVQNKAKLQKLIDNNNKLIEANNLLIEQLKNYD